MWGSIATGILHLPPWVALLVVFALPALESSAFVGFVFPGEVALILGGVLASQGTLPLAAVIAVAIAGASVGDSVGYVVGRRYGRRMLDSTLGRFVNRRHFDRAETYLAARGGKAVFFGRFTAALRVMIPGLAGMSGLRYRTFLVYNVASAAVWGTMSVLFGYFGGSNWRHVEQVASQVGLAGLVVVALVAGTAYLRHRRRRALPPGPDPSSTLSRSTTTMSASRIPDPVDRLGRTVVVIPTYNEAENIVEVIDLVRTAAPKVEILVVDDNSPDGTAHLVATHRDSARGRSAAGRVHLLQRTEKDGLGAAYRAGFGWALDRGYGVVLQMDADLSHPPERIPALLQALTSADIVVGSRYVPGGAVTEWSRFRRLISWAGNVYVRLVLSLPVRDATAGFKAFRADALRVIAATTSTSNGYCFQIENTLRAARSGLRVVEIPITFTDRAAGSSKMSGSIVVEAVSRVLLWRWHELRHGRCTAGGGSAVVGKHASADDRGSGHVAA